MNHLLLKKLSPILLLTNLQSANALSSDQLQPCYIQADTIIYHRAAARTIYLGHVHARQGTTQLTGDKVITYLDSHHRITRLIAHGHPAHYRTLPDHQAFKLYASANTIRYFPLKNQVLLLKKGHITQQQNVFTGPHIWYDIGTQTVVSTNPGGKSLTTMIIEPQATK